MPMNKYNSFLAKVYRLRFVIALIVAVAVIPLAFAAPNAETTAVIAAVHKSIPQIKVDEVSKTDIDGIYEIASEGRIFYFHLKSGTLFTGEMVRDGRSITAAHQGAKAEKLFSAIPMSSTVQIGKGKKVVVEFSDPDCPFCRRADEYLAKRTDVTVRLFMFPLSSIHPDARKKSLQILCSGDAAVYRDVMAGKYDKDFNLPEGCEAKYSAVLDQHIALGTKLGVNGTPAFWINGERVDGADIAALNRLLADKR
jgi:thiol:disulfide interchange protein DsbC